ncbi:hypothetical protein STVIR_1269 [Streptomyces viridochromogenes Tue57]|uniref:Uncharacterized protein n=1 Tax=Streptomyces viridochromogenes Tue57 TaxID=1160705 RepID=L8PMU6_STRVR|nr:hypothetical protein STVIR_1269 [Streptomyces viridochromogenes Tue57]
MHPLLHASSIGHRTDGGWRESDINLGCPATGRITWPSRLKRMKYMKRMKRMNDHSCVHVR